jgi:hypothetical protein
MPLIRGIGPTLIPRPQRMYLRLGAPIDTIRSGRTSIDSWCARTRDQAKTELKNSLFDLLQQLCADDPFRQLNRLAWRSAIMPS